MEYSRGLTKGAFITILVTQYSGQFNHSVAILYTALTAMSDLLISHQNLNNQCNHHKEQKKQTGFLWKVNLKTRLQPQSSSEHIPTTAAIMACAFHI